MRAKRFCRVGVSAAIDDGDVSLDHDMVIDEEESILEAQTSSAVEELKAAVAFQYDLFKLLVCSPISG